jgi:6-pyruvoyltetrahydropterin/6-carboxytetrahydropterin synthase
MVYLTRRYRFSAAHRLHSEALTAEENARTYGHCNNPYGHGHNYALEITMAGDVDTSTGMVIDLSTLDRIVQQNVLDPLDHTHLNLDVEIFRSVVPTTENLCIEIYKLLSGKLNLTKSTARLKKVRLEETSSNYFEYEEMTEGGGDLEK